MRITLKKMTCRALVVSLLAVSFQSASAGMISAEQALSGTAGTDRGLVLTVLGRADTAARLQAQGIDPELARARVAAMTDQEVQALAREMDTAPAGAGLDSAGWLTVILVAGLVWYFAFRK